MGWILWPSACRETRDTTDLSRGRLWQDPVICQLGLDFWCCAPNSTLMLTLTPTSMCPAASEQTWSSRSSGWAAGEQLATMSRTRIRRAVSAGLLTVTGALRDEQARLFFPQITSLHRSHASDTPGFCPSLFRMLRAPVPDRFAPIHFPSGSCPPTADGAEALGGILQPAPARRFSSVHAGSMSTSDLSCVLTKGFITHLRRMSWPVSFQWRHSPGDDVLMWRRVARAAAKI